MTPEDTAKLEVIFQKVLKLKSDQEVQSIKKEQVKRWDSMATVTLFAAIESEFGIRLDLKDAERFVSFESVKELLSEKRN